jgi:predicted O-methyltransferase YrrM
MARYAEEHGFPIIGPEAGGVLRLLARLGGARSVFEFGSGSGYSALWFLKGMPGGEVVLTEHDPDELQMAREFLERAGYADRATFESGDALSVVDRYEGPFDVVLFDHQKERYAAAFASVRGKVAPGGVVVADNVLDPADPEALAAALTGDGPASDGHTAGIADYLDAVRSAPGFETVVLPVGNGVALSQRVD